MRSEKRRGRGRKPVVVSLSKLSELKIECGKCKLTHPLSWDCPEDYSNIPEVPTIIATESEFSDPITFFRKLYKEGYHKFGAVRIQSPASWNPEFTFGLVDRLITTRIQPLKELKAARGFEQKIERYTFSAFTALAKNFDTKYKHQTPFEIPNELTKVEYEYWNIIDNPVYKDVKVEYAADLSATKYGSAFPHKSSSLRKQNPEASHPINLNNLCKSKNSLFSAIDTKISGLTSPWIYAGMKFSTFCWHVEDNYLHSINYMHKGSNKVWYMVPESQKEKFEEVIRELTPKLFKRNPNILHTITVLQNPLRLIEKGITVYKVVQRPGDFIMTFPKAYHAGFSTGANFAEAVNFVAADWIPFGIESLKDYEANGFYKKSVFPLEWVLIKNFQNQELDEESQIQVSKGLSILLRKFLTRLNSIESEIPFNSKMKGVTKYCEFPCSFCKEYQYLSYISCKHCSKIRCLLHNCPCPNSVKTIFLKHSIEVTSVKLN